MSQSKSKLTTSKQGQSVEKTATRTTKFAPRESFKLSPKSKVKNDESKDESKDKFIDLKPSEPNMMGIQDYISPVIRDIVSPMNRDKLLSHLNKLSKSYWSITSSLSYGTSNNTPFDSLELNNNFNHELFQEGQNNCFGQNKNFQIENCDYINRLFHGLQIYEGDPLIFGEFCSSEYKNILNDYIHLISTHDNEIEKINHILLNNNKYNKCSILNQCNYIQRNYSQNRQSDMNIEYDENFEFYSKIMDTLHQYLYHLFDLGFRMPNSINKSSNIENGIDFEISRRQKIIAAKQDTLKNIIGNCHNHNKYTLKFNTESDNNIHGMFCYNFC